MELPASVLVTSCFADAAASSLPSLFAMAVTALSRLSLSSLDIRPFADVEAMAVDAFPSRAALTALFCTGLVLVSLRAESTSILLPASTIQLMVFPTIDIPSPAFSVPLFVIW